MRAFHGHERDGAVSLARETVDGSLHPPAALLAVFFSLSLMLASLSCSNPLEHLPLIRDDQQIRDCMYSRQAQPERPDIVLVAFSGLRAGHGSLGEAQRALMEAVGVEPVMSAISAYAQSISPHVSLGSLLTGMYPSAIPLCGPFAGVENDLAERPWCFYLPPTRSTIAEVLSVYGYSTLLLGSSPHLLLSLDEGFQDHFWADAHEPWASVITEFQRWWRANDTTPRFVLLQPGIDTFDPTTSETGEDPVSGSDTQALERRYVRMATVAGRNLSQVLDILRDGSSHRPWWLWITSTNGISLAETSGPSDADRQQILRQLGSVGSSIVLERTIHVPLQAWTSCSVKTRHQVARPVQLVDVFPSIAAIAGAMPPADLQGSDLLSNPVSDDSLAFSEFGDMLALRQGNLLLTFRCYLHDRTSLDPEVTDRLVHESVEAENYALHDVVADPFQHGNLLNQEWSRALSMREQLIDFRRGPGALPAESLVQPRLDQLRLTPSQGYW